MTDHVLAVDLGTSGPKVAVFTLDGTFVDGDGAPVPLHLSDGGGAEQRPAEWWAAIVGATQRLMQRRPVPPETVAAVAVTSQWSGTVPIARDGTVLHDALTWMDARGARAVRALVRGPLNVQG